MLNTNKNRTIDDIRQDLLRHLSDVSSVVSVSQEFSSWKSNAARVSFVYKLLEDARLFPALLVDSKSNELSGDFRRKGNEMFKVKKNREAVELYTRSIALAEDDSECLALAYANRSAVLMEKGLYEECLMDIDRALKNNYPETLRPKILTRQERASKLKTNQNQQNYHQPIPEIPERQKNTMIDCAADSIEISYTEDLGRHIIATKDISVGEVLAVERPFCHILINQQYNHCNECLNICYNLIPCPKCTQAMYCSEKCRTNSEYYHKFQCPLMATMKVLNMDKLKLLPTKIATIVKNQYCDIIDDCGISKSDMYHSDRYREIHNLVANTELRPVADLFSRSITSAIIFHLVKTYTSFFNKEIEEDTFKELVLLHLQTAPCNFHEISELVEKGDLVYELDEIGAGAYSFMSMFNHSCSPNVVRHCYGPIIVLRALQSIRKGEQCYDNYGYHHALMNRSDRRSQLKKQYFFDCTCTVCKEDWPLYQNLPEVKSDVAVSNSDLLKLQKGDIETAKKVLVEVLPRIRELEEIRPNKNLAELQEVIKQCFALLGNIRRTL